MTHYSRRDFLKHATTASGALPLLHAASTLGASPLRVLLTVTLPLALPGILTGVVLSFARSLGACVTRPILVEHPPDRSTSLIDRSRSRQRRGPERLLTRHYWRIKLRRLFAKRVRGHRIKRA